jgi:acylphosphatase
MEVRSRIVVRGLVQGVGFRWFVHRKAAALGLNGWVQNAADGSVSIEAQGERSLVEELLRDVKVGPRSAQVTDLQVEWLEPEYPGTSFHIR